MAAKRFISHNRSFIPFTSTTMSVGVLINYSPTEIIKIYKIGVDVNVMRTINSNDSPINLFYTQGTWNYETLIPSDIHSFELGSILSGNIVHGAGGMKNSTTMIDIIPATIINILRRTAIHVDEPYIHSTTNSSMSSNYLTEESQMILYEHTNSDTQPITLRQNEGIFLINNVNAQVDHYLNNFIEFTIE